MSLKRIHELSDVKSFYDENGYLIIDDFISEFEANNLKYLLEKHASADYNNMWIEVPNKPKEILASYMNKNVQVFFNVSSGSPAMTSTWLFMKGTEDVDAEIISPQIDKAKNRKPYLHNIDLGTYPNVNKIKDRIQKTLGISKMFRNFSNLSNS